MLLKYFYDPALAQASYLVGCQATGEALVIDPARDIAPYRRAAQEHGLRIAHVAETHIHADFVSGGRELSHATGARLWLSALGGPDWQYALSGVNVAPLHDGEVFMVGKVRVEALHTPGHTPEHLVFQITDTAGADRPMGLFAGDCLFVGDIGRPDLLEEAVGIANTAETGARQQFHNIQRFKSFPDYLQVWPGHGAGSACGKALGAVPSTTLGYEKLFNPAFQIESETDFVRWLLDGQPEAPRYFARMRHVNRAGPALLRSLREPERLPAADAARLAQTALVIDTRSGSEFARGHITATLNVPGSSGSFSTYTGWFVDYDQPTYLIASEADLPRLLRELRAIGVDDVPGYFTPDEAFAGLMLETTPQVTPQEASRIVPASILLDVRSASEYRAERIPAARHIPMGYVPRRLTELPHAARIVVQCESGTRSQIAASLLQKHGYTDVCNLAGGIDAWRAAGLPLEHG